MWKTDDNGGTWQAVFEHLPSTSIGDLAVAPSNPDILWVGTGEANIFRASMPGVGIYKSTDGGTTFTHMGLTDTQTIARIVVHPTNPDMVYVAASGHEWTDNEMRGVFKTTDGGRTWKKVFYRSPRTGAIDLVMDPATRTRFTRRCGSASAGSGAIRGSSPATTKAASGRRPTAGRRGRR